MTRELCVKCQHVFDQWPYMLQLLDEGQEFVEYLHWESVIYLQKSADECILCAQFLHQFSSEDLERAQKITPHHSPTLKLMVLYDKTPSDPTSDDFWRLSLYLPLDGGPVLAEVSVAPAEGPAPESIEEIPLSTVCEETLSLARKWLQSCCSSHEVCTAQRSFPIPTRLVALSQGAAHLVGHKELSSHPKYATLSHCWGTLQILKLKKSNLAALQTEIPYNDLPKTFKDAIYIACQLGFQYLWIDSLCIIQDDEDDWRQESILMSSVYGGSALNIAAASAKDGSVGCVFDRNTRPMQRLQVSIMISGQQILYDCADYTIYRQCVSQTPLSQRAWVLQERVLAPRTLHFSAAQLFWECNNSCACETFPEKLPLRFHKGLDGLLKGDALEVWKSLLFRYTEAWLTYSKDRLIAISGIAQWISSQTGDEWVAGLWKRDLISQLCWSIGSGRYTVGGSYTGKRKAFRPRVYQAPSWSWASVEDGTIHLPPSYSFHYLVEILDVNVATAGADSFGIVHDGYIRLRCGDILCGINASTRTKWNVILGQVSFHFIALRDEPGKDGEILNFLPMAETSSILIGLIIEPTNREPGQFRRIGQFNVFWKDLPDFKRAMQTPDFFADNTVYAETAQEDDCKEMKHVITLI